MIEGLVPVVAEAQVGRGAALLRFAPGELFVGDFDQFLRRVRNHLGVQSVQQSLAADRIAHRNVGIEIRAHYRHHCFSIMRVNGEHRLKACLLEFVCQIGRRVSCFGKNYELARLV